ncbi:MAG: hypothetical protein PHN41_01135 [Bacteroidales bacterium]|jgi:DNA polymerase-3 subunit delta'|nr:hypothetical protein [Bacteroidales bacterium]MDX9798435.1 hypothetical protein [Bacteroidales bacterium]
MQFSQIIEQHDLINSLIRIADNKRVSHAQLFYGEESSKGFAIALAYAQFLNCSNKLRFTSEENSLIIADSCGECPSCKKMSKLVHPDLHLIFPNTTTTKVESKNSSELFLKEFREFVLNNSGVIKLNEWYDFMNVGNKQGLINVRDANNIIKSLSIKSYEAEYKIVIIWCIEKLHDDAAPKLLKTLEEPYDNTLFLLITDDRENIMPTILSRTQLVKVPSIKNNTQAENKYLLLFIQWIRSCFAYRTNIADILKIVESDLVKLGREEQKNFLSFSTEVFQHSFLIKNGIDNNLLENTEANFKNNFPNYVTENNIEKIYKEIDKSILHIERNGNAKTIFLDLSIQLGFLLMNK